MVPVPGVNVPGVKAVPEALMLSVPEPVKVREGVPLEVPRVVTLSELVPVLKVNVPPLLVIA